MLHSIHRVTLTLSILLTASRCPAQNPTPQLMIDGGASTAPVSGLAFSPDSSLLYVSGLDKTVQVWNLTDVDATSFEVNRVQQIFWETGRHHRGEITALAVSPTDGTIAIGGTGVRVSSGDIVLVDPANAQFKQVLPQEREKGNGHTSSVLHLDFSPSGKQLVSTSEDREVRVWNIAMGTNVMIRGKTQAEKYPPFLSTIFVNETQIAYLDQATNTTGQTENVIMLASADGKTPPRQLPNSNADLWRCLSLNGDGRFLLAGSSAGIRSWNLQTPTPALTFTQSMPGEFITSLQQSPRYEFLAGVSTKELKPFARLKHLQSGVAHELDLNWEVAAYHCVSALSPDEKWFVVGNNFNSEIKIWRLNPGQLTPLAGPLTLRSRILTPYSIQFTSKNNNPYLLKIHFEDDRAQDDVAIDLSSGGFYPKHPEREWRDSSLDNNFQVVRNDGINVPGIENAKALIIQQNGRPRCRITLASNQSTVVSSCWLMDDVGKIQGIAIGTNSPDCGVYAYRLTDNNQECELIRYFRDHSSDVISLAQSSNGHVLASASLDGTTKVWSLRKLFDTPTGAFTKSAGWGMELEAQPNGVLVKSVAPHGIAASRKIIEDDVIEHVVMPSPQGYKLETSGSKILDWLNKSALYTPQIVKIRTGETSREFYITPGWEPLVSLVIDLRKEWVAVNASGQFQSSLLEGDRLFNWLVSHGRDKAPTILPGANLRKELYDDFLLDDLFSNLDVAPVAAVNLEFLAKQPVLKVMSPAVNVVYPKGQAVRIRVELSGQLALNEKIDWQAYASNTPLGPPNVISDNSAVWDYQPSSPLEDILVRATHNDHVFTATQYLRSDTTPAEGYRLHLVAVGVDPTGELAFVDRDAEEIDSHFKNQRQRLFQMGYQKLLTNETATTENVLQEMKNASEQVKSRADLCVLFLSGHGTVFEDRYCFVSHDWKDGQPPKDALRVLSADKIEAAFDGIQCRRALVLDTCFSSNSIAGLAQAGKELRDHGIMIFSAVSGDNAIAQQNDQLQHGMFTGAILAGLRGPADGYANAGNINNQITMTELVRYVMDDVQRQSSYEQRPGFVPSSFIESNRSAQRDDVQQLRVISEVP